jgi:hypothetical protein
VQTLGVLCTDFVDEVQTLGGLCTDFVDFPDNRAGPELVTVFSDDQGIYRDHIRIHPPPIISTKHGSSVHKSQ